MLARETLYVYWDSSVFLAYINGEPGRVEVIDRAWAEIAQSRDSRIITSAISIAEVGFATYEKRKKVLDPQAQAKIDSIWRDPLVTVVEMPSRLAFLARDLMRDALPKGRSLRPFDAIHLATAAWVHQSINPMHGFYTYDDKLSKYTDLVGIPIAQPE